MNSWRISAWAAPGWRWGHCSRRMGSSAREPGTPQRAFPTAPAAVARAKSVIWIFLSGGVSHLETFDPKPALNKYAGKTYDETGLQNPPKSPLYLARSRSVVGDDRQIFTKIFPLQVGFRSGGNRASRSATGCRTWRVRRRPGLRALDVHDRQRPRRRVPDAPRPAHARRAAADDRLVGALRPRHAEREPAAVRVPRRIQGQPRQEELRRRLPRPAAHRRAAVARSRPTRCRSAPAARTCWRPSRRTSSP